MGMNKCITSGFYGFLQRPLGFAGNAGADGVLFGHAIAPFVSAYPFSSGVGVGTKYANPATAMTSTVEGIVFNSLGNAVIMTDNANPFVHAYAWTKQTGFGTKFAAPAVIGRTGAALAMRKAGATQDQIAQADQDGGVAQYISVWNFSRTGAGWGAKYGNPASLPPGLGTGIKFNPLGSAIAISNTVSPFIAGYPWAAGGFGTRYANPAVLAPGACADLAFSRLGGGVIMPHGFIAGAHVSAWAFNPVSGFGGKFAAPSYPGGFIDTGQGVATSRDSVIVGQTLSALDDQFKSWRWTDSSGFGTRHAHPARVPFAVNALAFSPNDDTLFMTRSDATRMSNRKWTDISGFGTLYPTPVTLPTGNPVSVCVH